MIDKNQFDVSALFNLFLTFDGDAARTAVAANVSKDDVTALADAEGWHAKVADLRMLKEASGGDVVVAMNRAVNFAQASRLRKLLDMVVGELVKKSPEALVDFMTVKGKDGQSTFSAKALAELCKASESAALSTQRALGDTVAERPEGGAERKGSSIAMLVQQAMSASAEMGEDAMPKLRKLIAPEPNGTHSPKVS